MGRLKLILGGIAVAFAALLVAGVAILQSIDFNQYKGEILEQAKKATGRDLTIDGKLALDLSFSPKVSVEGVTFANAPWGSRKEMVKLKSFAAEMKLLPLLFGDIHIVELILIEPDILLETDKKGNGNWVMGANDAKPEEKEEESSSSSSSLPAVNSIRIEKARFTYKDGVKGETTSIVIDTMQANAEDLDDPLNLLFKGAFNKHVIELSGQVGTPEALLNGEPLDINLALKAAGAALNITGQIKEPATGKGLNLALTAKSDNIARLGEIAGAKIGKIGPFEMAATISDDKDTYTVGGLNIKIAQSDLSGSISVNLANKTPYVNVALNSNRLAINEVTPAPTENAETAEPAKKEDTSASSGKIFPKDDLPVAALKGVNADVSFTAKQLIAGQFLLKNVSDTISLKNGKLVSKQGLEMGGGKFGGTITLNASKLPARLNIDLKGTNLGLGNSLKENNITDLIDGAQTQATVKLNATGRSVAGLMASLSGKTLLNVGEGKINSKYVNLAGGDLVTELTGALNPFAKKEDFTPLACIVVNLDFKNGVTDYDRKIAIQTDKMNVTSSGNINLAKETLSVGIKPEPRGDAADLGINAGGLASMVRLTGPLSSPGIGLDAMETAKAAMGVASAIATGGISLLASGLADKAMADSDPCATALGKKSAPKKSSSDSSKSTTNKPADPVGGLLNLFGKDK